ncbi:plant cysteine oxidase 2-like [Miscanthus floridulus]|uniref:plant cysteine oxidase 2-like n=1 Tax=Miscanthus floridulus TaxID=154761 RepID=UPI00345A9F91
MKTVEGSGGGGAPAAVKRRRRDAPGRRRSGGVSVRRRVQVDATTAPAPLQRLLAACRRAFGGPGTVPAHDDVALIRDILDKMGAEDVHLRAVTKAAAASVPRTHPNPIITRTTIYKCNNFSIVIFLLPPGAVIPLHDHPGMTVFSKLLLGSLHVTSYDWVNADGPPVAVGGGDRLLRLAKRVVDADLSAPCDALVLFPESGGNMHRFAAATACAVLDVLGPPYSGDRDCTYYQDLPYRHHHHDDDGDEAAGDGDVVPAATDDEQKPRLGWLLETRKPKELHMYEVPYRGPPILWKKRPAVDSWQQGP